MTEARTAGGGKVLITMAVSRRNHQRKREKTYELSVAACWIEEKDWGGVVSRGGELGSNEKFETSLLDLQYFSEFSRACCSPLMATHSFRLFRPLSSARRDSIVLIRCSKSTCNTQINFMIKKTAYVATNVIDVASQAGQRRRSGPIAHGRRIWLIDTSQAITATVEANGALSCTFCLFAPGGFPPSDKNWWHVTVVGCCCKTHLQLAHACRMRRMPPACRESTLMSMTERTPHLHSRECASRNRGAGNSDSAVGGKLLTRGELSCGEEEEVAWVRGSFGFPGLPEVALPRTCAR